MYWHVFWHSILHIGDLLQKIAISNDFFSSRVQVKTTAFSRNPRTIRSTQNLRQTQHPWTYRYSINLEKYIQMWVVNCCSSFNVVGFKSRFFPFCAPDVVDLYIYIYHFLPYSDYFVVYADRCIKIVYFLIGDLMNVCLFMFLPNSSFYPIIT